MIPIFGRELLSVKGGEDTTYLFLSLTGCSLPCIRSTSLYKSTCVPHQGFNNLLTPVIVSFKRRQDKRKYKQTKITEEKERLGSRPESTPIQNRLGPLKCSGLLKK